MNLSVLLASRKPATVLRLTKFMCCQFSNFMILGAVFTARHATTQPHDHHDWFLHTFMVGKFIEPNLNWRVFLRVCYDATLRSNCNLFAGATCSSCVPKGQGQGGEDEGEIVTCCVKHWKKIYWNHGSVLQHKQVLKGGSCEHVWRSDISTLVRTGIVTSTSISLFKMQKGFWQKTNIQSTKSWQQPNQYVWSAANNSMKNMLHCCKPGPHQSPQFWPTKGDKTTGRGTTEVQSPFGQVPLASFGLGVQPWLPNGFWKRHDYVFWIYFTWLSYTVYRFLCAISDSTNGQPSNAC